MSFVPSFFGLKLRPATKLIGWIDLIISGVAIIVCLYVLLRLDHVLESNYNVKQPEDASPLEQKIILKTTFLMNLIAQLVFFTIAILLLCGVAQKREEFLMAWIVVSGIRFLVYLVIVAFNFPKLFSRGFSGVLWAFAVIATGIIVVYAYVAVISYFQTLRRQANVRAADYREE